MLLLPPASPATRTERRTADRRKADRGKRAAEAADARAFEPVAEAERGESASGRRWKGGRRATEKAPETPAASAPRRSNRPFAPLVAQLIATALGVEQTRKRRRGSVEEAAALYRDRPPAPKPRGDA